MCRFLDKDGHCAFHSDDEVKEYCIAGPCPDMQTYNELIDALRYCGFDDRKPCNGCVLYDKTHGVDCLEKLHHDAADAIERLTAEVDRKDKVIHDMLNTLIQKEETIKRISEEMREQNGEYDEHLS